MISFYTPWKNQKTKGFKFTEEILNGKRHFCAVIKEMYRKSYLD